MANLSTQSIHPGVLAASDPSEKLAILIADAADDRKAGDITLIKIGDVSVLADYFVIVTGYSKVQVRAIANSISDKVKDVLDRRPKSPNGVNDSSWVLLDYGDVIAHVMMPDEREYYDLESFWAHGEAQEFVPRSLD
jgi:ribosome-associated protein